MFDGVLGQIVARLDCVLIVRIGRAVHRARDGGHRMGMAAGAAARGGVGIGPDIGLARDVAQPVIGDGLGGDAAAGGRAGGGRRPAGAGGGVRQPVEMAVIAVLLGDRGVGVAPPPVRSPSVS